MTKFASDYIDVASRIVEFRDRHPEGALQPADLSTPYRIETIGDQIYIVVVAAAYRGPDDQRPGIGMAYEPFPGRTPYTKGSELQNAETSAWGRAIVAALIADTKKGIASAEEVRNREAERAVPEPAPAPPVDPAAVLRREIAALGASKGFTVPQLADGFAAQSGQDIRQATTESLRKFKAWLSESGSESGERAA